MLINLRNAVLSLVAGSMIVTSAQAGHFGSGGGGGFAAKGMGNFNQPAAKNFGSPQTMVQRSSGSGLLNNSFKNQGQANFAKGSGQNNNVLNQVKNNTSQATIHNPFLNGNLSTKLNSNNATPGNSQSLFGKLNQKNGATNPTGAVGNTAANTAGNTHQSFMDKLNHKNNGQTQANATTTLTGVTGTGIQQTQGNANTTPVTGGATNVGVGTGNANPGNIGGTTGTGGATTGTGGAGGVGGTAGTGGNGGATGGTGGTGTGTGGMNGGNTNVNTFGGGGFLPSFLGALAGSGLGGGFGGGAGGGYAGPAYVDSAPQYVEVPAPQNVQTALQSAPATITPVSAAATAAAGSPMIASVEPLQGAESQVLVRGSGFGTAGNLALDVNGVQLVLEASAWTPNAIIAKVPTLNVANDAAIHFTAVRVDGTSSQPFDPSAPTVVANR